jgi:RNA polymerase sigma-70 factor (ECF subfamily)
VRANVFKIVRDEAITDDILQELFISLWNKRERFTEYRKISAWLFVASFNRSMNWLRDRATEKLHLQPLLHTAPVDDPEQTELQERQLQLLEQAIAQLPPQRRKVFELIRFQGLTYEQAANVLAISKNTVKDHLSKANDAIRDYLHNHPDGPGSLAALTLLLVTWQS